ncbi:hypothetical protein SEVIR_5G422800v4 [Setaria viridis]|uniref:Uncharacterized protein n=1 Tax=Setaria viridis TaxID=4556 RepID=A0A4U6UVQ7_SETVI|nr:uncharacterized protein LOC117855014 [Setaria viridis]TKW18309.1 hypothetical protein SEVIR_5G422800v2 [Setaria viridis]
MEVNGDEGIEQRKEDQLWVPPAAANQTTPTSTVPGKEVMSIDDEAISGVNPRSAAAAQNIVAACQLFVAKQNWDGLETYLAEFLNKVQGDKFYPHPGLFCSLYQAHISYLIGKNHFVEAQAVFDGKVKPLLDQEKDDMYKPFDLEARVQMLRNCVYNCLPLAAADDEDMNVVLADYLMLYFPTSLQNDAKRTNSISDFLVTFNDKKGKRHRCLACQWVMSASARSIEYHIKHSKQINCCRRVTKWMLEYLADVMNEKEISIQDMTAASSGIQLRKRKAPFSPRSTVLDLDQQFPIPGKHAFEIWKDLNASNMLALYALMKGKSKSTAAAKAKEILFCQEKLINELKRLFLSPTDKHVPLGSLAFMKIKALLNLSDDLLPLLKNLPDASELLLDQDKKVTELRRCFMVAAAERLPPTTPVDVTSPSTDSSESVSSKLCLL